jgi:xylose isomerase
MIRNEQLGAGLWVFGRTMDRYATGGYGAPVSTLEAIERAGRVGGMRNLDVNWPFGEPDLTPEQVFEAMERQGLRASAVSPNVFDGSFPRGSFTSPDPKDRRRTIDIGKRCAEIAHEWGADYVKFWAGQDGYDYPFQADYAELWDLSIRGMEEVARSDPQMKFAIEYKLREPRTHIIFSTAARTLLGIKEMGVNNVGIVYDMGHSLAARETPADVIQLLHRHGALLGVELNDNWHDWDDDMTVGSVNLIETLEYMYALRRIDWQGPFLLDQFPYREDPIEAVRTSFNTMRALDRVLDRLDMQKLAEIQRNQDALGAQKLIQALFLGELAGVE